MSFQTTGTRKRNIPFDLMSPSWTEVSHHSFILASYLWGGWVCALNMFDLEKKILFPNVLLRWKSQPSLGIKPLRSCAFYLSWSGTATDQLNMFLVSSKKSWHWPKHCKSLYMPMYTCMHTFGPVEFPKACKIEGLRGTGCGWITWITGFSVYIAPRIQLHMHKWHGRELKQNAHGIKVAA